MTRELLWNDTPFTLFSITPEKSPIAQGEITRFDASRFWSLRGVGKLLDLGRIVVKLATLFRGCSRQWLDACNVKHSRNAYFATETTELLFQQETCYIIQAIYTIIWTSLRHSQPNRGLHSSFGKTVPRENLCLCSGLQKCFSNNYVSNRTSLRCLIKSWSRPLCPVVAVILPTRQVVNQAALNAWCCNNSQPLQRQQPD